MSHSGKSGTNLWEDEKSGAWGTEDLLGSDAKKRNNLRSGSHSFGARFGLSGVLGETETPLGDGSQHCPYVAMAGRPGESPTAQQSLQSRAGGDEEEGKEDGKDNGKDNAFYSVLQPQVRGRKGDDATAAAAGSGSSPSIKRRRSLVRRLGTAIQSWARAGDVGGGGTAANREGRPGIYGTRYTQHRGGYSTFRRPLAAAEASQDPQDRDDEPEEPDEPEEEPEELEEKVLSLPASDNPGTLGAAELLNGLEDDSGGFTSASNDNDEISETEGKAGEGPSVSERSHVRDACAESDKISKSCSASGEGGTKGDEWEGSSEALHGVEGANPDADADAHADGDGDADEMACSTEESPLQTRKNAKVSSRGENVSNPHDDENRDDGDSKSFQPGHRKHWEEISEHMKPRSKKVGLWELKAERGRLEQALAEAEAERDWEKARAQEVQARLEEAVSRLESLRRCSPVETTVQ